MERFWAAVAETFPEVETGDFEPDATHTLRAAMEAAVDRWLYNNHNEGTYAGDAAARIDPRRCRTCSRYRCRAGSGCVERDPAGIDG
tara:strand:+ start:131 stop:391 length:261 start_codon:yes stop_codon:yes gene_type:complete